MAYKHILIAVDLSPESKVLIYCSITLFHTAIKRIPKCALALKKTLKTTEEKSDRDRILAN
ncbi:hypothetical protein ONO57_26920, partial [Salmonella enterica subsp. enterica serovar Anatum]|nr:hypothetical protein [Salmonella enterica subsp. enterica serovar Anatum]